MNAVLDVPRGWVTASVDQSTIKIVEPETKAIAAPLSGKRAPKAPRASVAVATSAAAAPDPRSAAAAFVDSFAACVPLRRIDAGSIVFRDGVEGAFVTIAFEVVEGRGIMQRHFFRIDGAVLTQITGTVADWQKAKLDRDITPIAISVRSSQ